MPARLRRHPQGIGASRHLGRCRCLGNTRSRPGPRKQRSMGSDSRAQQWSDGTSAGKCRAPVSQIRQRARQRHDGASGAPPGRQWMGGPKPSRGSIRPSLRPSRRSPRSIILRATAFTTSGASYAPEATQRRSASSRSVVSSGFVEFHAFIGCDPSLLDALLAAESFGPGLLLLIPLPVRLVYAAATFDRGPAR